MSAIAEVGTIVIGAISAAVGWRVKRDLTDRSLLTRLRKENVDLRLDVLDLAEFIHKQRVELAGLGGRLTTTPALRSDAAEDDTLNDRPRPR